MVRVSSYTNFRDAIYRRLFLWAGIVDACDELARTIRNKEHRHTLIARGLNKVPDAGDGRGIGSTCPFIQFPVGERSLIFKLKVDVADYGLVDVENNCGRERFGILLVGERTPRPVLDILRQRSSRRLIHLTRNSLVLGRMLDPQQAEVMLW